VPEFRASVDGRGSLRDHAFAREVASTVIGAVSLAALLAGTAQITKELPAARLVPPDVGVDGFVAHRPGVIAPEASGDLLGAPLLPQAVIDALPLVWREAGVPAGARPSAAGAFRRGERAVAAVGRRGIPANLPGDRAPMPPQDVGHL
jgi:hypothetical protein